MAGGTGDTLTISFRGNTDHQDDPDKIPCPLGFSGLVIDPDAGTEGPRPPELPQTNEGTQSGMRITLHLEGGSGGGGYSATTPTAEHEGPRAELSVRFAQQDPCPGWADRICWRPYPLAQLHLDVTDVIYTGTWEGDEALPTLSGGYDETTNTITLTELEGEEGEEGGGKPSIKIMWPTGNLAKYLRLGGLLNNWYELDYRLRDPDDEVPTDQMPPMWVDGPNIPSDLKIVDFGPEQWDYAFRTPVRWSLARGLLGPGTTGGTGIEEYADWTTPDKAYKPSSKGGGWIQVADDPEPGEEPGSPGIDFNEEGLNKWLSVRGAEADPLDDTEYTLLMEILPSFGRFNFGGKYLCADEIHNLHGEWSFYSQQSTLFDAPRVKVPVAYLKLNKYWVVFSIALGFRDTSPHTIYLNGQQLYFQDDEDTFILAEDGAPDDCYPQAMGPLRISHFSPDLLQAQNSFTVVPGVHEGIYQYYLNIQGWYFLEQPDEGGQQIHNFLNFNDSMGYQFDFPMPIYSGS